MTNKLKMALAIMFTVALGAFSAMAHAEPQLYVGTEFQHTQFNDVVSGEDAYDAANLHVGVKMNDFVGAEVGVSQSATETTGGNKIDLNTYNADLVGYMPVTETLDLLGTVGMTYTLADGDSVKSEQEWGYAVGTGLEYSLTDSVSLRGLVRYEDTDLTNLGADSAFKYVAGVNYSF